MADFVLSQQEYEALISLAREGASGDTERMLMLEEFLKKIEANNGITRSILWVRWQEMSQPLPPTTRFPDVWPPEQEYLIELVGRLVARVDVEAVLAARATSPTNVMVTSDPNKRVGWTTLDDYFIA